MEIIQKIEIFNKCPTRVWFRIFNSVNYVGIDLGSGESYLYQGEEIFNIIRGQTWEKGESDEWKPTFESSIDTSYKFSKITIDILPIIGPRIANSIKVFLASCAGQSDPALRNDFRLINKFIKWGVPHENVISLYEKQISPVTFESLLSNCVKNLEKSDILFIFLHLNGTIKDGLFAFTTGEEFIKSEILIKQLKNAKGEIYLLIDSNYSGNIINDIKKNGKELMNIELYLLTSTYPNSISCSDWKFFDLLIKKIFEKGKYTNIFEINNFVYESFSNDLNEQRANILYI